MPFAFMRRKYMKSKSQTRRTFQIGWLTQTITADSGTGIETSTVTKIISVVKRRMKKVAILLTVTKAYQKVTRLITNMPNPSTSMINMSMTLPNRKSHIDRNKVFVKKWDLFVVIWVGLSAFTKIVFRRFKSRLQGTFSVLIVVLKIMLSFS